ncbi:MAG: LLM class flavin-dependent oxidoreductase, partial [Curtobacterium sp.]
AAQVEASGAAVVVLGADRFAPERGRGRRLDPTTVALALGRALPGHGLIVAAAPTREHPYNVARRVLSLDHVLGGRVGLLVGARDHGAPPTPDVHDPAEFAEVVRGLWRTWPLDSIVGDREQGVFAETSRITPLHHDGGPGGYRVRGPLTTPSSRQGEPVLGVWHDVD